MTRNKQTNSRDLEGTANSGDIFGGGLVAQIIQSHTRNNHGYWVKHRLFKP